MVPLAAVFFVRERYAVGLIHGGGLIWNLTLARSKASGD